MNANLKTFSCQTSCKREGPQNKAYIYTFRLRWILLLISITCFSPTGWSSTIYPVEAAFSGILDIGIYNNSSLSPVGNKLQVNIRPTMAVNNGIYSEGKFTIRCQASLGIVFSNISSNLGFEQYGDPITNGAYTYYIFTNVTSPDVPFTVNWSANTQYELLNLTYDCAIGNAIFEIIDNAYVTSIFGEFYQELNAFDETGIIFSYAAPFAAAPSITATINNPVCVGSALDLGATISGGNGAITHTWSGPIMYSSMLANPLPFTANLSHAGTYAVTMTDGNGCSSNSSILVNVYDIPSATLSGSTTIVAGGSATLTIAFTGPGPWDYSLNGIPQPTANTSPAMVTVSPTVTTTYTITQLTNEHCSGPIFGSALIIVRSVLIDIGISNHAAAMPAGNKLQVKIRPAVEVVNGLYTEGKFTIRCLESLGVVFSDVVSGLGFEQYGASITNGAYRYFIFSNVTSPDGPFTVNWTANNYYEVVTLTYSCTVSNATFEIIDNAYVASIFGEFYQELNAADETGIIYAPTATSGPGVLITASSNSPICDGKLLDLSSSSSGGVGVITYQWTGPNMYVSSLSDPTSFASTLAAAGTYTVNMTDGNGCLAASSTNVIVNITPTLSIVQPTAVCIGKNLNNVVKGQSPLGGTFSYHLTPTDAENNTNILIGAQVTSAAAGTYGVRYTLNPSGCFTTGAITVTTGSCVMVDAKVFLQGPFDVPGTKMKDDLRHIVTAPVFPLIEPYSQYNTAAFKFAFTHVNGGGGEVTTMAVMDNDDANNAIVDWVFLELRNKNDYTEVMATRSALVQRDGNIVDMDGVSKVLFSKSDKDQYYLMVRHRNHLGAMTAATVDYTIGGVPFTDFTDQNMATFGTTPKSARVKLGTTNFYGLWAGNTNLKVHTSSSNEFVIKYNQSNNDRSAILTLVGSITPLNTVDGYYLEDVNLNGTVKYNGSFNDRVIILNNVGASDPLNFIFMEPSI